MLSRDQIPGLLDQLVHCAAADLETQTLDFKEWKARSDDDSIDMIVEAVICMANADGGCLLIGVRDNCIGRENAILGIPWHIEADELKRAIHNKTDPRMTPEVEEIAVREGTGRLLLITVAPTQGIQTDTQGKAKIRVGTDCQSMTGSIRVKKLLESGDGDYTAGLIPGEPKDHLSEAAMEILRQAVGRERAPTETGGDGRSGAAQLSG